MAKLYFRYGAMGSSKSANILMVRYNYEERGQYAVLLKPRTDNRDGQREIKSRMGLAAPAEYVDNFLKEISKSWSETDTEYRYQGKKVDAILIDEAQFLSAEEVDTLSDIVDFYEIPVLCYGLRTDFLNHLFPGSKRLMEIADVIEEVPTVCWCGKRAQCNTRYADGKIVREGAQIMLGSNESYVALCRKHYKEGTLWKPTDDDVKNHLRDIKTKIYGDIKISENQIKEGQVKDAQIALKSMRDKYGL